MPSTIAKIKRGEYKLLDCENSQGITMLASMELWDAIGFKFIVKEDHLGGIGVYVPVEDFRTLMTGYLNAKKHISLTVTGGDYKNTQSVQYKTSMLKALEDLVGAFPDQINLDNQLMGDVHLNELYLLNKEVKDFCIKSS